MVEPIDDDKQIKFIDPEGLQPEIVAKPTDSAESTSMFWQRSFLAQGIGWLGGIGLLSSSIVWPQNHTSGSAVASPKIPELLPKAAPTDSAPSQRQAEPVFTRRTPAPSANRTTRNRYRVSQRGGNDYSNSYIDPTDYSLGATRRGDVGRSSYRPPNSVVFSERYRSRQRVIVRERYADDGSDGVAIRSRARNRGTFSARIRDRSRSNQVSGVPRSSESRRRYRAPEIVRVPRSPEIERRSNSYQVYRSPRPTDIDRRGNYQIVRVPRSPEIERRSNPYQIVRVPRATEIDRRSDSLEISRVQRRRSREGLSQANRNTLTSRRRGVQVATIDRVKIGPIRVNTDRVRLGSRNRINRQSSVNIASADINAPLAYQNPPTSATQNPPNPALRYYYDSTNPVEANSGTSNLALRFPLAIPAQITSMFGWRMHPLTGERGFHAGTDIGAPMGTPVLAAHAGRVAIADMLGGYGLAVVIRHNQNSQETRYGHLSEIFVKPGEWVEPGTVIGRVGNTGNSSGPHLHFEVREQTPQGWVAKDPGTQLESALSRLVSAFQSAQVAPQPYTQPSEPPQPTPTLDNLTPNVLVPNAELPEITIPRTVAPPPSVSTRRLLSSF